MFRVLLTECLAQLIAERDRLNKDLEQAHSAIKSLESELDNLQLGYSRVSVVSDDLSTTLSHYTSRGPRGDKMFIFRADSCDYSLCLDAS